MKKTICLLLSLVCLALSCFSFSGCATPPAVEDIYDRVVELIEASYEVNTVFYGPGLPVYETNSKYAQVRRMYYNFDKLGSYEFVTEYAKFMGEEEIMLAAEKVYSAGFLNDVLAMAAFTGYASNDGAGGVDYMYARYLEDETWFYQSTADNTHYTAMRVYDYSTMQVLSLGRSDACKISMDSWLEDSPEQVETVELSLLLQDGEWYLDSFSGA